jgi:hypothetical protein
MYYLSKETAVQAFNSLIGKVENKFLGLLGILKNIKSDAITHFRKHNETCQKRKYAIEAPTSCIKTGIISFIFCNFALEKGRGCPRRLLPCNIS